MAPVERWPVTAPELTDLTVAADPAAWEAAGFRVEDGAGHRRRGEDRVRWQEGKRITGWSLHGLGRHDLDGLPTARSPEPPGDEAPAHPNGIDRIDHVVAFTPDMDRTVAALEAAGPRPAPAAGGADLGGLAPPGLLPRRPPDPRDDRAPARSPKAAADLDAPARFWGLAFGWTTSTPAWRPLGPLIERAARRHPGGAPDRDGAPGSGAGAARCADVDAAGEASSPCDAARAASLGLLAPSLAVPRGGREHLMNVNELQLSADGSATRTSVRRAGRPAGRAVSGPTYRWRSYDAAGSVSGSQTLNNPLRRPGQHEPYLVGDGRRGRQYGHPATQSGRWRSRGNAGQVCFDERRAPGSAIHCLSYGTITTPVVAPGRNDHAARPADGQSLQRCSSAPRWPPRPRPRPATPAASGRRRRRWRRRNRRTSASPRPRSAARRPRTSTSSP